VWSAAYVGACRLALPAQHGASGLAFAAGFVVFLPLIVQRIVVLPAFDLVTLAYFASVSLAVPVVLVEGKGFAAAFRRAVQLARADYVHELGSLATLVLTIFLSGLVLVVVLHGFGDQAIRVAALLALLVLAPVFLIGAALLYLDQAARESLRVRYAEGSRSKTLV
jgi:hypothetical protein